MKWFPPSESNPRSFAAHSQGTVIVADYLRLRRAGGGTAGNWQYLSFGSPLRQLYAAHFPHWYKWITDCDPDRDDLLASLGLKRWANLYGAGDYVGRRVFRSNDLPRDYANPLDMGDRFQALDPTVLLPSSNMVDACVGPLAHTRYTDGSAPHVARTLRYLIAQVAPGSQAPATEVTASAPAMRPGP